MSQGRRMIIRRLKKLRWSRIRSMIFLGLLCMIVTGLSGFCLFLAFDLIIQHDIPGRYAWGIGIILLMLYTGYRVIIKPSFRKWNLVELAQFVEEGLPQIENILSTAVEYELKPELIGTYSTMEIVEALQVTAEQRTRGIDFHYVLPRGLGTEVLKILGILLIGNLIFALFSALFFGDIYIREWKRLLIPSGAFVPSYYTQIYVDPGHFDASRFSDVEIKAEIRGQRPASAEIHILQKGLDQPFPMDKLDKRNYKYIAPQIADDFRYYIKAGSSQSTIFSISVYDEPNLEKLTWTINPPENLNDVESEVIESMGGDISALSGSLIQLKAVVSGPVVSGELRFSDGRSAVPLTLISETELTGEFELWEDMVMNLRLKDDRGKDNKNPAQFNLKATRDMPPEVIILYPGRNITAERDQILKVNVQANDDYGITSLKLHVFSPNGVTKDYVIKEAERPELALGDIIEIDLPRFTRSGGSFVVYYAYAIDNDTVNGPKKGLSRFYFIEFDNKEIKKELVDQLNSEKSKFASRLNQLEEKNRLAMIGHPEPLLNQLIDRQREVIDQCLRAANGLEVTFEPVQEDTALDFTTMSIVEMSVVEYLKSVTDKTARLTHIDGIISGVEIGDIERQLIEEQNSETKNYSEEEILKAFDNLYNGTIMKNLIKIRDMVVKNQAEDLIAGGTGDVDAEGGEEDEDPIFHLINEQIEIRERADLMRNFIRDYLSAKYIRTLAPEIGAGRYGGIPSLFVSNIIGKMDIAIGKMQRNQWDECLLPQYEAMITMIQMRRIFLMVTSYMNIMLDKIYNDYVNSGNIEYERIKQGSRIPPTTDPWDKFKNIGNTLGIVKAKYNQVYSSFRGNSAERSRDPERRALGLRRMELTVQLSQMIAGIIFRTLEKKGEGGGMGPSASANQKYDELAEELDIVFDQEIDIEKPYAEAAEKVLDESRIAPEDEPVPSEYREHVTEYFRVLSED